MIISTRNCDSIFMNKFYIGLIIATSILLSSCTDIYGPETTWHRGYTNTQIDSNTFTVSYDGLPDTSSQTVQNYMLYRCAELTFQNGFDYFIIIDKHISARHDQNCNQTFDTHKDKKGNWVPPESGSMDCEDTISYTANATIKTYKGKKPANNPFAYNANELMMYLNSQINR